MLRGGGDAEYTPVEPVGDPELQPEPEPEPEPQLTPEERAQQKRDDMLDTARKMYYLGFAAL